MATKQPTNPPPNKGHSPFNLIFKPVGIALGIVFYIGISVVVSVIVEWVGMAFFWDANHAQRTLQAEFAYLGDNFSMTLLGVSAKDAALMVIGYLNNYLFNFKINTNGMMVMDWLNAMGESVKPYLNAAVYICMVTAVRCVIIALSSVMFIIIGLAAIVDGLHRRELRKLCGGVEYGGVYHRAKAWVPRAIIVSPVLYLAWPSAINPNWILLPGMGCFFLAVYISFATYKKYI